MIDEAHAYDTYMTALSERLLAWLAALGAPVVLPSATRPAGRRRALLHAYADGLGVKVVTGEQATYPRISWLPAAATGATVTVHEQHVEPSDRSKRTIALRWLHGVALDDEAGRAALGAALQRTLGDGEPYHGCIAVIGNTVARAQSVDRALTVVSTRVGGVNRAVGAGAANEMPSPRARRLGWHGDGGRAGRRACAAPRYRAMIYVRSHRQRRAAPPRPAVSS